VEDNRLRLPSGKESVRKWEGFNVRVGENRCRSGKDSVPKWERIGVEVGRIRCDLRLPYSDALSISIPTNSEGFSPEWKGIGVEVGRIHVRVGGIRCLSGKDSVWTLLSPVQAP